MSEEKDEEIELPEVVKDLDEDEKKALVNLIDSMKNEGGEEG